ncbi:MAG: NADH-quinone oxidoreductase subunit NuoN [Actinomycetaceae bacterium]|nr:NADH-quinone oxidoreductase subunit NuoN [Actinomycetaceae bacterium]
MDNLLPSTETLDLGLHWVHLMPVIVILAGAAIGVLLEAFVPRKVRWTTQIIYTPLVVLLSAFMLIISGDSLMREEIPLSVIANGEVILDGFGFGGEVVMLIIGLLAIFVMIDRTSQGDGAFAGQPSDRPGSYEEELTDRKGYQRSEMMPLSLFSLGGMMIFPMANSMLTMFIALEIISLPMYVLAASARRRRLLSQEAALKYFILGAFASAFFLMGTALLFGYSASLNISVIARAIPISPSSDFLLLTGVVMMTIGLLFKVGAAPFHAWTPDVYQGAPTPVTGYMAAGVKAAAFMTLTRFYLTVATQLNWDMEIFMWTVAIMTMIVGTFFGLVQGNIKRMLAYSSIAHAGFMLIALIGGADISPMAVTFYVLTYGVATVGAFGVVYLVRTRSETGSIVGEANELQQWKGLGKTSPLLAVSMMIFLLSFAGIPLTAGFIGKFLVFSAGIEGGATILVFIAVISSAITAFYYFRLAMYMFLSDPDPKTAVVASNGTAVSAVVICVIATIVLGLFPGIILNFSSIGAIVVP